MNDATSYYLESIVQAVRALGYETSLVPTIAEVPPRGAVITVDCKRALEVLARRPRARVWVWLQGAVPEEARLQFDSRVRELYWNWFERLALPRVAGAILVSEAMREHLAAKHGLAALPSTVVPCTNQELAAGAFDHPGKYERPTFVYAGSMHRWQCMDATVASFARIQSSLPAASLTILTREADAARAVLERHGARNAVVDYVPPSALSETLARFKYGFVLREPHVVNAVATPTKVSSYMAAGVIPVTTTAVRDYAHRLPAYAPVVLAPSLAPDAVAAAVLRVEREALDADAVRRSYARAFEEYFGRAVNVPKLRTFFEATGLPAAA